MEVLLINDVFELGSKGQLVTVADGYGRNYLLPKRLAILATSNNREMIERQQLAIAKREAKNKKEFQLLAEELNQLHLLISRKSGETGALFGSVNSKDVVELLEKGGFQLDRRKIALRQPIKNIGNYNIDIRLHKEVVAKLLLTVLIESGKPINEVKKKDAESEQTIKALESKIAEINLSEASQKFDEKKEKLSPTEKTSKDDTGGKDPEIKVTEKTNLEGE